MENRILRGDERRRAVRLDVQSIRRLDERLNSLRDSRVRVGVEMKRERNGSPGARHVETAEHLLGGLVEVVREDEVAGLETRSRTRRVRLLMR